MKIWEYGIEFYTGFFSRLLGLLYLILLRILENLYKNFKISSRERKKICKEKLCEFTGF